MMEKMASAIVKDADCLISLSKLTGEETIRSFGAGAQERQGRPRDAADARRL